MPKFNWNSEKLLSFSAMGISFITLIIFIYQTNLMSRQNHLSIMPYLDLARTDNVQDHLFELNLKNHGVGPAIIESVKFEYAGKSYDLTAYNNSFFHFVASIAPELDSLRSVISWSTLDKGMAIPSNTIYNIIRVNASEADFQLMKTNLDRLLQEGLDYEIIYKSIQEERWKIFLESEGPEKL